MTRAYVALGSNVDPEANVHAAVLLLAEREHVVGASTFYRTAAIPPGAPDFVNGVLALETPRRALALKLDVLRDVESRLGRARTADKNAPRTIDCDLLIFDDEVSRGEGLVLPSPDIEERAFVAIALCEIAPELVLPGSGRRLAEICASVPAHPMAPLAELTNAVRRALDEVNHESSSHRGAHPPTPH